MTQRSRGKAIARLAGALLALSACDGGLAVPRDASIADAPDVAPPSDLRDLTDVSDGGGLTDVADAPVADAIDAARPWDAGVAPCDEVDRFAPLYRETVSRWSAQDALGPWPADPVVFVGSSSIRRWEGLARSYSDYAPIQRGFGGAQLGEVARSVDELVVRHAPRAVVVYAGTNDLAAGVSVDVALDRLRCLRHRVGDRLGWSRPVLFVGVAPNPARWSGWPAARAFNAAVESLAASDPGLVYVDVATPFLATGSPPDASLFVRDGLHLTARGYALWDRPIRAALEAVARPRPAVTAPDTGFAPGARILVDVGPSNPEDGEAAASPDHLGQRWNSWHPLRAPGEALPGERLVGLVTATGAPTRVELVIAGGFLSNGRRNGGLLWPDAARLGSLAVGGATGDFFYVQDEDAPGAIALRGLDPSRAYTLRLFAARDDAEVRITRYEVSGATTAAVTLQTSGAGAGRGGATVNDDDVATLRGVRPDAWGSIFVDVAIERGTYAYLSAFELIAE